MNASRLLVQGLFVAGMMLPAPVLAEGFEQTEEPAFAGQVLSSAQLSEVRGSYLGRTYMTSLTDVQARDDFRQTAVVGTLTFDNWFNDVGAALILNAALTR